MGKIKGGKKILFLRDKGFFHPTEHSNVEYKGKRYHFSAIGSNLVFDSSVISKSRHSFKYQYEDCRRVKYKCTLQTITVQEDCEM